MVIAARARARAEAAFVSLVGREGLAAQLARFAYVVRAASSARSLLACSGAELGHAVPLGLKGVPAFLANQFAVRARSHDADAVFAMPLAALWRSVPSLCSLLTGLLKSAQLFDSRGIGCALSHMFGKMPAGWLANKVGGIVVKRIAVCVIDVMARRNCSVYRAPDLLMERAHAALAMVAARPIVHAEVQALGVGIAAEFDPVEDHRFDHVQTISPYRTESNRVKPRSAVQIG